MSYSVHLNVIVKSEYKWTRTEIELRYYTVLTQDIYFFFPIYLQI